MIIGIICLAVLPVNNIVLQVVMLIVLGVLAVVSLIGLFLFMQTATLSAEGISFKCSFIKVVDVQWNEIKKVELKSLPTLESKGKDFNFSWIILYTDMKQQPKNGGGNFWNKPPWQIKATPKNIKVLKQFIDQFASGLEIRQQHSG